MHPTRIIGLMMVAVTMATSSKESEPWNNPCRAMALPSRSGPGFRLLEPEDETLRLETNFLPELKARLRIVKTRVRTLKKSIDRRLGDPELKKECKKSPSLRGMPLTRSENVFSEDWEEVLTDDFRRLATVSVFIHQMVEDSHPYSSNSRVLLRQVIQVMCSMEQISTQRDIELSYNVDHEVMPAMYRNLPDQSMRDRRNCLIVRDVAKLVKDLLKWYT